MKLHTRILAAGILVGSLTGVQPAQSQTGTKEQGKSSVNSPRTPDEVEIVKLRDDYIKATQDYKVSLQKLLPLLERNLENANASLARSKELAGQGLISSKEIPQRESAVKDAESKVREVEGQIMKTDQELAAIPTAAALLADYRKAQPKQKASARGKVACRNWRIEAYHRETARATTISFKLICER